MGNGHDQVNVTLGRTEAKSLLKEHWKAMEEQSRIGELTSMMRGISRHTSQGTSPSARPSISG